MLLLSQIVRLSFTNCRSDGRLAACVATLFYEPVINPPRCVTLLLYALRIICVEAIPNEVFKHVHLMVCNIVMGNTLRNCGSIAERIVKAWRGVLCCWLWAILKR